MGTSKRRTSRAGVPLILMLLVGAGTSPAAGGDGEKTQSTSTDDSRSIRITRPARFRLGGVHVGGFYSHHPRRHYGYYAPYLSPYYWSYYGPYGFPGWPLYDYYSPLYYPGVSHAFDAPARAGEVKLQADPKTAEVYINGSYAGTAGELKSFRLESGAYDLEIKAENHVPFQRRIYILSGKTVRLNVKLNPERKENKP